MRATLIQVRRVAAVSYLGRYLTPDEWKCVSNSLGTKLGERFPVLPVLQLLKQERYTTRKSRKPWLRPNAFEQNSFIRSLLCDKECEPHKTEWYLTMRSLYDYIIGHCCEQPKRTIFDSFINAAFEAKKWQEAVDCFESLQNSSITLSGHDGLSFKAAVAYGKLGRYVHLHSLSNNKLHHF